MLSRQLQDIQDLLIELEANPNLEGGKSVAKAVVGLLVPDSDQLPFRQFSDQAGKLSANAGWFETDSVVTDRLATYVLEVPQEFNLDVKLYGVKNASIRTISWSVGLTENFEDEPFNGRYNVGIDFIIPKSKDRVIIALSKNYVVRTLELKGKLTATFQQILESWAQIRDFSRKPELHSALWGSFDLNPVNKRFYEGISQRFIHLRQYLENEGILEAQHAAQFANRLIGRVIFAWFLEKKGFLDEKSRYFASEDFDNDTHYYRDRLETLFFKVLNQPVEDRTVEDRFTPYLNGGLFESKPGDLYQSDDLKFPKSYFDDLLGFLRGYNFTTDESTSEFQQVAIDPEMLGRIFENLLAEFSEETGEQARKAKGAFYTPREVVDSMCKETLKGYLRTKIEVDEYLDSRLYQLIDAPEREYTDQDHNWKLELKPYKDRILSALDNLRVLDPACGSGAFPIGMMQLLVKVYGRIESRFDPYKTKLGIIEKNIYGVDIEPMAVEISRLRAWLALVVDVNSSKESVKPLPNLDFKFLCANSLIDLDSSSQPSLFDDNSLGSKLQAIRNSYFSTQNQNKKVKLRAEYANLAKEEVTLFGESERTAQLKSFKPFESDSIAKFFNPIEMFGLEAFDIVIGNPPYVSVKSIDKNLKIEYSKTFFSGKGRFNLFTLFLERGQKLLSQKGQLSFILPDSLFSHTEYRHIRDFLVRKTTLLTVGVFSKRVFEAAVDTAIVHFQNGKSNAQVSVRRDLAEEITRFNQSDMSSTEDNIFPVQVLAGDRSLLDAIRSKGSHSLTEFFDIQQGIIYSGQAKEDVFANSPVTPEFKPILDGRDVIRWGIKWSEKLENRYIKYSSQLHRARDEGLFLAPRKIVMPRRSTSLVCAVDEARFYALNTAYILKPLNDGVDPYFFVALLNSKLVGFYYSSYYFGWQITIPALKALPMAIGSRETQLEIAVKARLVHEATLQGDERAVTELCDQLDQLVFELYGLSEHQIAQLAQ
jgi:type I restriction-modification system DNA methylase subunit